MPDDRLATPLPTFADTRLAAHRLAVYVVSPARRRATGRIGLRAGDGAVYVTPAFDGRVVRLEPGGLVRRPGGRPRGGARHDARRRRRVPPRRAARRGVREGLRRPRRRATSTPRWRSTRPPPISSAPGTGSGSPCSGRCATRRAGTRARSSCGRSTSTPPWTRRAGGGRITFGASPGDATSDEPYLYVLPPGPVEPGETWNATGFTGAVAAAVGVRGRRRPAGRRARVPAEPPGRRAPDAPPAAGAGGGRRARGGLRRRPRRAGTAGGAGEHGREPRRGDHRRRPLGQARRRRRPARVPGAPRARRRGAGRRGDDADGGLRPAHALRGGAGGPPRPRPGAAAADRGGHAVAGARLGVAVLRRGARGRAAHRGDQRRRAGGGAPPRGGGGRRHRRRRRRGWTWRGALARLGAGRRRFGALRGRPAA